MGPESFCLQCKYVSLEIFSGPELFLYWGGGIKCVGGIKPINMFINISLFS